MTDGRSFGKTTFEDRPKLVGDLRLMCCSMRKFEKLQFCHVPGKSLSDTRSILRAGATLPNVDQDRQIRGP